MDFPSASLKCVGKKGVEDNIIFPGKQYLPSKSIELIPFPN
jgi:hypothetical protein